jgi:hypothetical protein
MTILDDILNVLLPKHLTYAVFKFADRVKSQHFLAPVLALCTTGFNPCVGQAGVRDIHQVQVSNYSPVPNHSVVAQPQMLFLVLDQHLDRPSFQIVGHNSFHGGMKVVRNQGNVLAFSSAAREYHLDSSQFIDSANSFRKAVGFGLSQSPDIAPLAAVSQDIFAVSPQFAFNRAYCKAPVGLAYANIMPAFLFTGLHYCGAQIKGIEQDGNLELLRQTRPSNGLGCQVGKFVERNLQRLDMFLLDIQPAAPRYGYSTIVEAYFHDGMAETILASSMVAKLSNGMHLLSSLESLRIIDDEEDVSVAFAKQAAQHVQSNILHNLRFAPATSPQKLAVISSVSRTSQSFGKAFYSATLTYGDCQNQRPKVPPGSLGEVVFKRGEKTLQFSGYFADSNHTASPAITYCFQECYRPSRPFLFDNCYHQNLGNRSV